MKILYALFIMCAILLSGCYVSFGMFEYGRQESEYPDSEATDGDQGESDNYHVWHGHRHPSYPSASEKNKDGNNNDVPSSSDNSGKTQSDKTPVATAPAPVENKTPVKEPAKTEPVKTEPSATVTPPAPAGNAGNVQEETPAAEKKDPVNANTQESADKKNKDKTKGNNRDKTKDKKDKTPVKEPGKTEPAKTEPSATVTPPAPAGNAGNVQKKTPAAEKKDPVNANTQENADKKNKDKTKGNNRDKTKDKKDKAPVKEPAKTEPAKAEPSATVTPPAPAGNAGNVQEKTPEAEKKEPVNAQSQESADNGVAKGITAGRYSKYKFTPAKSGRYRIEIRTELDGWGVNMSLITTTQYASWDANPALQNTSKAYDESGKAVKDVVTGFMEVDLTTDAVYELSKKDGSDFTILSWTLLN